MRSGGTLRPMTTSVTSIVLAGFLLGISLIVAMGPQNILLIKQGIRREGITAVVAVCFFSDVILFVAGVLGVGKLTEAFPSALDVLRWVGAAYLSWFAFTSFRDCLRPKKEREQPLSVVEKADPQAVEAVETVESTATTGATVSSHATVSGAASASGDAAGGTYAGSTAVDTRERGAAPQTPQGGGAGDDAGHRAGHRPGWLKPMLAAIALTWLNPGAYLDSLVMIGGIAHQYGDPGAWWFITGCLGASAVWFVGVGYGAGLLSGPLSSPRVWRVLNGAFGVILVFLVWRLVTM